MNNPLFDDREVAFLLHDVLDVEALTKLPAFAEHGRETFDLFLGAAAKLAREHLYPAYRPMDQAPPELREGAVHVHPCMAELWSKMVELGVLTASRPPEVGGAQIPLTISTMAHGYLMAANLAAFGYAGLTIGAARLIESFGSAALKARFMGPMYEGRFSGTMALTEPQAGSSLSDVMTKARPRGGAFAISGTKVFLSGGDQQFTENIVHLTLARIEGAPPGVKGISLFAVPKRREDGSANDVVISGLFHKMGWKGLPSVQATFGENDACLGWLVGEPHQGLRYMFQMMNEARLMVGMNGAATAAVAYRESLEYARTRPQGRPIGAKDPSAPQVPIIAHADVRRMLLRQKAIGEGALSMLLTAARFADLAEHGEGEAKAHANLMLELLTPIAKTFPAEYGFESNALAVQIHGGYGYTSEYLPESWLRDQKLNTIHEGTTGIHGLDLLGRKVMMMGGAAMHAFHRELTAAIEAARGVDPAWPAALADRLGKLEALTMRLAERGLAGDAEGMTAHATDYLTAFSIVVVAWQWLRQATAAAGREDALGHGKRAAAEYWFNTELPKVDALIALVGSGETSFRQMEDAWF